jgi:hypothetical protein
MKRKGFAYLLVLLLSSTTTLDDRWAAATEDPSDDALAAENNEYLPSPPQYQQKRSAAGDLPLPGVWHAVTANPFAASPARGVPVGAPSAALSGTPLLYLLMSLQR